MPTAPRSLRDAYASGWRHGSRPGVHFLTPPSWAFPSARQPAAHGVRIRPEPAPKARRCGTDWRECHEPGRHTRSLASDRPGARRGEPQRGQEMWQRLNAPVLLTLLAALHVATCAEAASLSRRCRKVCRGDITACVAAGEHLRACRKSRLGRCKREGVAVCHGRRTTTTSTTTPGSTTSTTTRPAACNGACPIHTVFVVLLENHDWSSIKNSPSAPYINNTLLPMASHAEQYYNPPGVHPSAPNYLWLDAGTNFGVRDDNSPANNHQGTTGHLVSLLEAAGVSWKTYQEDISGTVCPVTDYPGQLYVTPHNPFVFFDDVTGSNNPADAYCIVHVRPYSELATDLSNNTVARDHFITPNVCNDMHGSCAPLSDNVKQGDA